MWTSLLAEKSEAERSPLVDLIDEYWVNVDLTQRQRALFSPGQMFWAPIIYRDDALQLLRLEHYDPQDERKSRFRLTPQSETIDAFNHFPVKDLGLRSDEEMVVFRAKHRSAALFSVAMTQPDDQPEKGRSFLLVPHYSFHPDDPADLKESIRLFQYSALFHAPAHADLRIPDGFFRFDRISVVPRQALIEPMGHRLSNDAFNFMTAWFDTFRTGVLADDVLALLIDEARKARDSSASSAQPPQKR
jgi:hypothetical protein